MTKLPIGRLARHAYLDVIGNWQELVRVGGPWLLLSWALLLLSRGGSVLFVAAADLAVAMGTAAIAVIWHRHILLAEPLTRRMAPVDVRVLRYFVFTMLLAMFVGGVPLLVLLLTSGSALVAAPEAEAAQGVAGSAMLLVAAALLACLYVALRLQLVFPAMAIDDRAMTLGRSWAVTRGNGWRLFLGFLLTTMPVAAGMIGLTLLVSYVADVTGSIVLRALSDLAAVANAWLQAPLIASFLAYAYLFLQPGNGARPVPVSVAPG